MQSLLGRLIFSATDLSGFLACPHLTLLKRRTALGGPKPPQFDDPGIDVLQRRGVEHEQKFLAGLQEGGTRRIVDLTSFSSEPYGLARFERHTKATINAMRAGADVIYQGMLFEGDWLGYPDFLTKVSRPSDLGDWSYEVVDTKLAREAKAGALIQVLLYTELLEGIQGVAPDAVHLALGGPDAPYQSFRVKHYSAYFRSLRKRFLDWVVAAPAEMPQAVDPVAHCDICAWDYSCTKERREVDHLSFVAGISRQQRRALMAHGLDTLAALGGLDLASTRIDGIKPGSLSRIQLQAKIQLESRRQNKPLHELLKPAVADQGLAALPVPSEGDLFFDLEGDPYAFELGIEYLFGVADAKGEYIARWSLDQTKERETFQWFMDYVTERLKQFPDLHIYHYAAYEPSALKRLAGRYDTRIEELDQFLRGRVFVDLYRVVRQGLRASVESYSIKKMEPFYQFERQVDLRKASSALANFEAWLQMGGSADDGKALLTEIEGYNQDDCISTLKLRDWLERLRVQLAKETGADVPRPSASEAEAPAEQAEKLKEIHALMDRLMAGAPELE
jgi:predicted RecB family nuclease